MTLKTRISRLEQRKGSEDFDIAGMLDSVAERLDYLRKAPIEEIKTLAFDANQEFFDREKALERLVCDDVLAEEADAELETLRRRHLKELREDQKNPKNREDQNLTDMLVRSCEGQLEEQLIDREQRLCVVKTSRTDNDLN